MIVKGDPNPSIYCNNLPPRSETIIPINREENPSSTYVDLESLKPSASKHGDLKGKYKDNGMGEFTLN